MYDLLAALAAAIGVIAVGAALYTLLRISFNRAESGNVVERAEKYFQRWTALDAVMIALFAIGALFLMADVIGIVRERNLLAYHHYGYTISGVVYCLTGMLFMVGRLIFVLRRVRRLASFPQQHQKPNQTHTSK
ncbi:hypothetical protein [Paenibacillus senegalensis]|uniref:hypothetical protein n=1 Tax=Paenibacillus senegalensis TaxID=1465766 RepID=UPI0011DD6951|nr:hypothetical protein [Paenibacillus senegalensis]